MEKFPPCPKLRFRKDCAAIYQGAEKANRDQSTYGKKAGIGFMLGAQKLRSTYCGCVNRRTVHLAYSSFRLRKCPREQHAAAAGQQVLATVEFVGGRRTRYVRARARVPKRFAVV